MIESESVIRRDFSRFDGMSTDMLRDILRQDFLLPEEESDADAVLYIAGVLAGRDDQAAAVAEAAWDSFNRNYRNTVGGLYEDDAAETAGSGADASAKEPAKPRRLTALRVLSVAVILLLALLIGTITTYARGYDLFGTVAKWTEEVFGFRDPGDELSTELQYSDELSDLIDEFVMHQVSFDQLPRYIPEGYKVQDTRCAEAIGFTEFYCLLRKEDGNSLIILHYRYHETEGNYSQVEKDDSPPEIYKAHGTEYYIVKNVGKYIALWTSGNLECSINMVDSRDELIKMIDSILE